MIVIGGDVILSFELRAFLTGFLSWKKCFQEHSRLSFVFLETMNIWLKMSTVNL